MKRYGCHSIFGWALLLSVAVCFVAESRAEEIVCFPMDSDPGWTMEGQWAFGVPLGGGSHSSDPTSGYTGANVYGYNLAGDYTIDMPVYNLTTTALDCSGFENVSLTFQRWLGVEGQWDHAGIEVSNNGFDWFIVWRHTSDDAISDSTWVECTYDISDVADDEAVVYIRWYIGPADQSVTYPGWNIDDVCLRGDVIDTLLIEPLWDLNVSGYEGGPFYPPVDVYILTNTGSYPFDWTIQVSADWLNIDPNNGTLLVDEFTEVAVSTNETADTLLPGTYTNTLTFTNVTNDVSQIRRIILEVLDLPGEIDIADSIAPSDDLSMPFGDLVLGLTSTESITITNTDSEDDLLIHDISICQEYSDQPFSIQNLPTLPRAVPPGDFIAFDVVFDPVDLGQYVSGIAITSNDLNDPDIEVALTGTAVNNYLVITPESDTVFSGHPGGPFVPSLIEYHLRNDNITEEISWSAVISDPCLIDVSPDQGVLVPNGSITVVLTLKTYAQSLSEGQYANVLEITETLTSLVQSRGVTLDVFTSPKVGTVPEAFVVEVAEGADLVRNLSIGNTGDADLVFTLECGESTKQSSTQKDDVATSDTSGDKITVEYLFDVPTVSRRGQYDLLEIDGLELYERVGSPIVPVRPVEILVPPGKRVAATRVIPLEMFELTGSYSLPPAQKPYPLGHRGRIRRTRPNPKIYDSSNQWPPVSHKRLGAQSRRGYRLLNLNLFPLRYVPARGKVICAGRMRLEIDLVNARQRTCFRPGRGLLRKLTEKVDNPAVLESYSKLLEPGETPNPDSTVLAVTALPAVCDLPANGPYKYVIITSAELESANGLWNFQALRDMRILQGLTTTIVTTEYIYANYDGTRPDGSTDNQTRIRNFLIDAYQNWGTEYALLGGTNDIVPARMFWVDSYAGEEDSMPSDLYYACLEPSECTFDHDADGLYGEPTDGIGGEDVDLYGEIYVGRAPVADEAELNNFVGKTLSYDHADGDYLNRAAMLGEHLGFDGLSEYAKDSLEQIRLGGNFDGYFTVGLENHTLADSVDFVTVGHLPGVPESNWPLYDKEGTWPKSDLVDLMNGGMHIFDHFGHASQTYCMKLSTYNLSSLNNTDYFFLYSQGCKSGWFDSANCFAEVITSMEHGAFAAVMNARYGWGTHDSTNGPSQRFNRQFWDAVLGEDMPRLGRANQDSKEDNLWNISGSCVRWCYYELNLFGDPTQQLKLDLSNSWLRADPQGGVVCPDDTLNVNVTFDARDMAEGIYSGEIVISSNDIYTPSLTIPVTMTVTPDPMVVMPEGELAFSGVQGGPFAGDFEGYTITNSGGTALVWSAGVDQDWLEVDPNAGVLNPGVDTTAFISLNAYAQSLPVGQYLAELTVTNTTTDISRVRPISLEVRAPDCFTEHFDSDDNDMSNRTLTFIPDDSCLLYHVCGNEAWDFPVDPCGGTVVALGDDDYAHVSLGEELVYLYGLGYDSFYIGSNGYITFNSGDLRYQESFTDHFSLPRISALFDDLDASAGESVVSRLELDDRIVVTFQNVPERSQSNANSFQIEMFFSGWIRVTWLGIDARDGLVGLSRGNGLIDGFVQSDLSGYDICPLAGDLDGDGDVDMADYSIFASWWLADCGVDNDWCHGSDVSGDGQVSFADLFEFAANWLVSPG